MNYIDVICPTCRADKSFPCHASGRLYARGHSRRHVLARKLTSGPEEEDVLFLDGLKCRLRGGLWRMRGDAFLTGNIKLETYDTLAGMWRGSRVWTPPHLEAAPEPDERQELADKLPGFKRAADGNPELPGTPEPRGKLKVRQVPEPVAK